MSTAIVSTKPHAEDGPIAADIAMHALLVKLHAERGAVELGYAADLYLAGIKTALATCIGPEAARKTFERHAEAMD